MRTAAAAAKVSKKESSVLGAHAVLFTWGHLESRVRSSLLLLFMCTCKRCVPGYLGGEAKARSSFSALGGITQLLTSSQDSLCSKSCMCCRCSVYGVCLSFICRCCGIPHKVSPSLFRVVLNSTQKHCEHCKNILKL